MVGVAVVGVGVVGVVVFGVGVGAFKYFDLLKNYLFMCFASVGVIDGIRFVPVIPL